MAPNHTSIESCLLPSPHARSCVCGGSGFVSVQAAVVLLRTPNLVLAVSRRGVPSNLGFPGGGIEPGENAAQCAARELKEETTLVADVRALRPLFDRQDGNQVTVCRTFGCDLHEARGMAKSVEPGIVVSWVPFRRLLSPSCTFHTYNAALFQSLGIRC